MRKTTFAAVRHKHKIGSSYSEDRVQAFSHELMNRLRGDQSSQLLVKSDFLRLDQKREKILKKLSEAMNKDQMERLQKKVYKLFDKWFFFHSFFSQRVVQLKQGLYDVRQNNFDFKTLEKNLNFLIDDVTLERLGDLVKRRKDQWKLKSNDTSSKFGLMKLGAQFVTISNLEQKLYFKIEEFLSETRSCRTTYNLMMANIVEKGEALRVDVSKDVSSDESVADDEESGIVTMPSVCSEEQTNKDTCESSDTVCFSPSSGSDRSGSLTPVRTDPERSDSGVCCEKKRSFDFFSKEGNESRLPIKKRPRFRIH